MSIHYKRVRDKCVLLYIIFYSLTVTDADEELFEDNPEEYIRRDIEGSGNAQRHAHAFLCYFCTILLHVYLYSFHS